jgi:hypothetical protein
MFCITFFISFFLVSHHDRTKYGCASRMYILTFTTSTSTSSSSRGSGGSGSGNGGSGSSTAAAAAAPAEAAVAGQQGAYPLLAFSLSFLVIFSYIYIHMQMYIQCFNEKKPQVSFDTA